jgi:hypothetical protein
VYDPVLIAAIPNVIPECIYRGSIYLSSRGAKPCGDLSPISCRITLLDEKKEKDRKDEIHNKEINNDNLTNSGEE